MAPEAGLGQLVGEHERAFQNLRELQRALERTTQERDRALSALETAAQRRDEFLAILAHELRNPLAPLRSAAEILRLTAADHAKSAAASAIIERQVRHLARLIEDLVDVSRLTRGKLELRKTSVDLAGVLRLAVESNRPLLEGNRQRIALELADEPLVVEGDATRLAQVFGNLINNAAKFSAPSAEIGVHVARGSAEIVITVSDAGAGIASDRLERIFDAFAKDAPSAPSPQDGLGVGLTLAKHLVELHGGSITARSAGPGRGSEFAVRLECAAAAPHRGTCPPPVPADLQVGASRRRILIADDNQDAAQSLALLLGLDGHEVRTVGDGLEALEVAESFRPQIALLDIGMPRLDGYETARRLRHRPWAAQTRLFALTGWGQEEVRQRAQAAGFDRLLVKPVEPDHLTRLLDALLPVTS